ncbi:MAG: hypothetical protein IPN26_10780 [Bacteroidetes bacterium]|nr:hypothetical protein [Bacteroidota bacterium]
MNNTLASVSARNFNPEEASRYVASREDIARMATNFAGVRGSDDSRNDIVIRGNTPNRYSGVLKVLMSVTPIILHPLVPLAAP